MATELCLKLCIYNLLTIVLFVNFGLSQIDPPTEPPVGTRPVVANGIVYNLWHIPGECQKPEVMPQSEFRFGIVIPSNRKKAIMRDGSPYRIHGNIALSPHSCLYIEPGTVMYFGPGYGMIINGTLIGRGSELEGQRIVMTKDPDNLSLVGPSNPFPQDARLVDGNKTLDGRLELFYMGKWRGICTNYNNFTKIDANVTCRHLGFVWGNFTYNSFSRNKTEYMLFEKPECKGTEDSLFDCPGRPNIRVGSHICDGQQVIGFECAGLRPDLARDHWRGLEFYNATVELKNEGDMQNNETLSFLEYLDISYAGKDIYRGDGMVHGRASISASPYVPLMNNITVINGAYDGLNFTEVKGRIHIANSTVSNHRGYGVYIESAVGRVLINKTDVDNNWGDGVKMYMKNFTINNFERDFPADLSFCRTPSLSFPSYPMLLHEDIVDANGVKPRDGFVCKKKFPTLQGKRITLHFLLMERDPAASGTMTVYDQSESGKILAHFPVSNGTFPQSVTSITNKMFIKFQYRLPPEVPPGSKEQRCKIFRPCFRFLMELWSGEALDEDLRFFNSSASNNNGYGVNVQDMRCKVFVNSSVISNNNYGAGFRVFQGAGEVAVNNSLFEYNVHSAINVTYAGGYTLINKTRILNNRGYGIITEYERLNRSRVERGLKMEVVNSVFAFNKWISLRVGNYCKGGEMLVNESHFNYNHDEAIEYLSCNISMGSHPKTNFSLAYNTFDSNERHGVLMSPLINSIGRMTNNTFKRHKIGAVRIDNGYDLLVSRWYANFPVTYEIFANKFTENYGRYCASLRLTQNAQNQKLDFKFNIVHGNYIYDSSIYLNPRNRANAPIVASSSNVAVQRNAIYNPDSVRDIATHLIDPSVTIDGSLNWWGTIDHKFIYGRYFDNDDRYNLAVVNYYPVLKDQWLYGDKNTNENTPYRWVFASGNRIGGVLDVPGFTTDPSIKIYHVNKDIFINPAATLTINPGTTLEFENSIGMVVHGRLKADGHTSNSPVIFRLKRDGNETAIVNRTATVKLMDGIDEFEGRVEVEIDGEWGTVCREEWNEQNSAVVCQQLGLTYNPQYGKVRQRTIPDASKRMLLNRVQCDILDIDVTKCRAEVVGEFSCSPDMAVYVRCQPPTWSGVTIPGVPTGGQLEPTQIRYLTIENAGLLDYEEMMYTPALRIDYNFYKITGLIIRGSVSDGVNIKYSNPHTENLFEYCKFDNNQGNGFVTKSPDLKVHFATMNNNVHSGFVYNPFFSEYEALSVRNFIHRSRINILRTTDLELGDNSMVFIQTEAGQVKRNATYVMQLHTRSWNFRVTLQLLDYNPLTKVEKVTIYDGRPNAGKTWEIERDLVDFPIISTTKYLTIELKVNGILSGRLTFAAHSRQYSPSPLRSQIYLHNCTMQNNYQGIITHHYNNPSNEKLEIFHRIKQEEIRFQQVYVLTNHIAMYIPSLTKYTENLIPSYEEMTSPERVGEITYIMENCRFIDNYRGIVADHNHVDFANNVWHWHFRESHIRGSKSGGLEIDLPRVNDIEERKFHSVNINESFFVGNQDFALTVAGYYANVTMQRNNFQNNLCKRGLISLSDMEKDLYIYSNDLRQNTGKFMLEVDLRSHSEYSKTVSGLIKFNRIMNNLPGSTSLANSWNFPSTYSVALKGVQNVIMNRNVIDNKQMQYELVAGINSLKLDTVVDVKENWWGTPIQSEIRQRIFDFDDWNNYAIAVYFPQLTSIDVNGRPSTGEQEEVPIDLQKLGGRITKERTLPLKNEPYIVVSDITVMPDAKLIIQPGTELQFYPNVGILVLGQLKAKGLPLARIKFGPVETKNRVRRAGNIVSQVQNSELPIRLRRKDGAMLENEGFLELFNSSTNTWNIMCDSQLTEKTAEVVCREMGLETINVDVRFTHLYDHYIHGKPMYFLKEFWTYSYYCRGDEPSLDFCMKRINYDIQKCIQAANYTFIRCGERNLPANFNYWGNIRIAPPSYEEEVSSAIHVEDKTILQYVDVDGAGLLHSEKVGAIQSSYKTPVLKNINITRSVSNGIDIIAPRHDVSLQDLNITNNLGYAMNVLVLNGESKDFDQSSFIPLSINTIPYHLHGLVEICKMEKEIIVKNRLIVYFKYSQTPMDCVKVVKSQNQFQKVALRFLQFNLYEDAFYRNVIEIFDGDIITQGTFIGELLANSTEDEIRKRYMSTGQTLSIHIHASTAFSDYGFIAEVVTSPLSGLTYPDINVEHRFQNLMITKNQDGAMLYKNVGEVNPSVFVDMCMIENNGLTILNLTSNPILDFRITDTGKFNFEHNFVHKNKGGMQIVALAQSQSTSIRANITNNVFSSGTNGETLNITGHHYNRFYFYENYIHNNLAGDFRDTIHFQQIVVNFTFTTVINNTGHHILQTFNTEDTGATQRFLGNAFIENNTTAKHRSVIKIGKGKPIINSNFLLNEDSEFELQTSEKKRMVNGIEVIENTPIDVRENWWGSERRGYINGKIWDNLDNSSLISVQFDPYKVTNLSLVDGKCSPGWHLNSDRCFRYMGAALTFEKAVEFCEKNNGFLAEVKDRHAYLHYLLRISENAYKKDLRVWVYSDVSVGFCSAFENTYIVAEPDCHLVLHPFICQKEPYLSAPGSDILSVAIGISAGVFGTALIVIIILIVLWKLKSRRRKDERFERRSSIRSSARSRSNLTMLSNAPSKRRIHELDKYSVSAVSSRSRYDSDEKSQFTSEGSIHHMHMNENDYDTRNKRRPEMNGRAASQDRLHERNGHVANRGRFGSREGLDSSDRRIGSRDRLAELNRKTGSRDNLNDTGRRYGSRDRLDDGGKKYGSQDKLDKGERFGSQDRLNSPRAFGSRDKLNDSGRFGSRDRLNDRPGSRDKLNETDRFGSREGLNDSNRRLGSRDGVNSSNRRLGDRRRDPDKNIGPRDGLNTADRKMGSRDKLNENSDKGRLGSRDRLNEPGRLGSQDRLNEPEKKHGSLENLVRIGSRDRLLPEPQVPPRETKPVVQSSFLPVPRNYEPNVANDSPGSTLERKLIKHVPPSIAREVELEMYTTDSYDGYSTNEFDDTTSVEDENEKKAFDTDNDDTNTVRSLHASGPPPRVENEIDSMRMVSSIPDAMYDNRGYLTSPSIEYNDRSKSLSSFSQPNSPVSPSTPNRSIPNYLGNYGDPSLENRAPTPPPPLPVDSIPNPMRQFRNSPVPSYRDSPAMSQSSDAPVPVPRNRPIPPPRPNSLIGSKDSVKNSRDNVAPVPLNLSRESLDYIDEPDKSNLQDHQICDISKSEDSLDNVLSDRPHFVPSNDNLAYLHGSREHLANQYSPNVTGYTNGANGHVGYGHDTPQYHSRSREDVHNEPYNLNYGRGSRDNLNTVSRSRENIHPVSRSRENIHDDGTLVIGGRQVPRNQHAVETDV